MIPGFKTREYHYKGADPGNEQRNFWILVIIAVAVCLAIVYLF